MSLVSLDQPQHPHPGPLTSIHARIPTPHGTIVAKLTDHNLELVIPHNLKNSPPRRQE